MDQPSLPESTPPSLPTSTMAIVSLIAGILGLLFFPFVGGIVAIVTANMARKETRSYPPTRAGDGMATAGMVMGWLSFLIWFLFCCMIIMVVTIGYWSNYYR